MRLPSGCCGDERAVASRSEWFQSKAPVTRPLWLHAPRALFILEQEQDKPKWRFIYFPALALSSCNKPGLWRKNSSTIHQYQSAVCVDTIHTHAQLYNGVWPGLLLRQSQMIRPRYQITGAWAMSQSDMLDWDWPSGWSKHCGFDASHTGKTYMRFSNMFNDKNSFLPARLGGCSSHSCHGHFYDISVPTPANRGDV